MPWWRNPFRASVNKWIEAIEAGNAAREKLRTDQYYELWSEDLVVNPEPELRGLWRCLGGSFDAAMLEPYKTAPLVLPQHKLEGHHQRLQLKEINTGSVGKWREELSATEAALVEAMAAKQLSQYGYALSNQDVDLPQKRVGRIAELIAETAEKTSHYQQADARRQRRYGQPVQALLTRGQIELFQQRGQV